MGEPETIVWQDIQRTDAAQLNKDKGVLEEIKETTSAELPKEYLVDENKFLRPSYAPRGVNTLGATAVCMILMISKFTRAGKVFSEGEMTVETISIDTN